MVSLDVGCGDRSIYDVRVDLGPITFEIDQLSNKPVKTVANFYADAHNLPFRNEVFNLVHCSHTIEHSPRPLAILSELIRVSKDKIIVRCPHRLSPGGNFRLYPAHKSVFNRSWFLKAFQKFSIRNVATKATYDHALTFRFLMLELTLPFKRIGDIIAVASKMGYDPCKIMVEYENDSQRMSRPREESV